MKKTVHNYTDKSLKSAKAFRKNQTIFEKDLWAVLRNRNFYGLKFRRQVPIGNYIVDFICKEKNIILELDGFGHLARQQIEHDKIRDTYLSSLGYTIVRIKNTELRDIDAVLEYLYTKCFAPSP